VTGKCGDRIVQQGARDQKRINGLTTTSRGSTKASAKLCCRADQVLNSRKAALRPGTGGPGGDCAEPFAHHTSGWICRSAASRLRGVVIPSVRHR